MTIGKKRLMRVMVHIEVVTNMDNFMLEQRFDSFIDPTRFRSESLDPREFIRFTNTKIDIHAAGLPEPTMQLPIVEPASDGMKLQAIQGILGILEEIKAIYSPPEQLEMVVFQRALIALHERIAKIVGVI